MIVDNLDVYVSGNNGTTYAASPFPLPHIVALE
jgi:hypothetical protein